MLRRNQVLDQAMTKLMELKRTAEEKLQPLLDKIPHGKPVAKKTE
jgi:hypothetical protein